MAAACHVGGRLGVKMTSVAWGLMEESKDMGYGLKGTKRLVRLKNPAAPDI